MNYEEETTVTNRQWHKVLELAKNARKYDVCVNVQYCGILNQYAVFWGWRGKEGFDFYKSDIETKEDMDKIIKSLSTIIKDKEKSK